jgi:hypothetical protein
MQPSFAYAGRAPKVVATRVVALYDADTGRIHHTHTVLIHAGGRDVPEHEALAAAQRMARKLGHDTARLKVKMSADAEHGRLPHAINLASGEFIAIRDGSRR